MYVSLSSLQRPFLNDQPLETESLSLSLYPHSANMALLKDISSVTAKEYPVWGPEDP